MPLDWLFGSKKKAEQDHHVTEEKPNSSSDDFVMLDSDQASASGGLNCAMYPQLPYAISGNSASQVEPLPGCIAEDNSTQHEVTGVQGFLSGVPFKLTSADTFQDIDSATAYHLRANQFITHVIEGITTDRFSYDFQVEKSVLHEAGCRDLG